MNSDPRLFFNQIVFDYSCIIYFQKVFGEETTQQQFFSESGIVPILDSVLNEGYSASIFAYGQTGTGKTYTITGPEPQSLEEIEQHRCFGMPTDGIIPQSATYIFNNIEQHPEYVWTIVASYLELYNEQVCFVYFFLTLTISLSPVSLPDL